MHIVEDEERPVATTKHLSTLKPTVKQSKTSKKSATSRASLGCPMVIPSDASSAAEIRSRVTTSRSEDKKMILESLEVAASSSNSSGGASPTSLSGRATSPLDSSRYNYYYSFVEGILNKPRDRIIKVDAGPLAKLATTMTNSKNRLIPNSSITNPQDQLDTANLQSSKDSFDPGKAVVDEKHALKGSLLPPEDPSETIGIYIFISTYISFGIMLILSFLKDVLARYIYPESTKQVRTHDGYAALMSGYDSFFTRRLYRRIRDCWNRPITGTAGKYLNILIRRSNDQNATFEFTGEVRKCLNLSSYNYLGFSEDNGPCLPAVKNSIWKYGLSSGLAYFEGGRYELLEVLEKMVAKFVGKESALLCNMGYATNLLFIPALMSGKGTLVISDQLNHTSLVFGVRLAGGATVKVFRHCDLEHLEQVLREQISQGQPKTHRPWKKIIVLVEGLYSMEGTIPHLPTLLSLKRKYKFYLWIDEAHSIGATGPQGRGICDYFNISPKDRDDIDLLMGTFTKSFGAAGGYIAGSNELVSYLKVMGYANYGNEVLSSPIVQMVLESMSALMNCHPTIKNGALRLNRLRENSLYLRAGLQRLGFCVLGEDDSPVIPLIIFQPAKMAAFSRELLSRKIACVVVAYPATPMNLARVRFCMNSLLTISDLDDVLTVMDEIGDLLDIKYHKKYRKLKSSVPAASC